MIPKIIRIALVALAILVMALAFPKLYKKTFEQRERNQDVSYSEVLNEFVTTNYQYDTTQMRELPVGRDKAGHTYDASGLMTIFPMKYCRQLVYENRFPDTLCGIPITMKQVQEAMRFPLFLGTGGQHKPLLWMFESHTDRVQMELPQDMFRITEQGVEFIETGRNRVESINREKSRLFTDALKAEGFMAPDKNIYGITSTTKSKDDGYFIVDSKDDFYHLKMVDGQPVCHKIPLPNGMKVDGMNCLVDDVNYGYVYDQDFNIYLLRMKDYSFFQLPIYDYKDFGTLIVMDENLFYYTYRLYGMNKAKFYVMDKAHNLLAAELVEYTDYTGTKVGQTENYIFPFKARFTRDGAKKLNIEPYDICRFMWLNAALMIILAGIKLYNKRSFRSAFNYIDLVITMVCGIYGFLAVLIFPNRK